MILGFGTHLASVGMSAIQKVLSGVSQAALVARFDGLYGAGGLYYAESASKTFSQVIANGPAGEPTSAGMLVDGVDAPTLVQGLGPELVLNHDFAAPTDWTLGVDWEIVNGQLVATAVASFVAATQLRPIEIGARYKVVLDIADITSGTIRVGFSGGVAQVSTNFSTAGVKEFELTAATGNDRIFLNTVNASVSCKINSISVRKVLPHPNYSGTDHTVKVAWNANSTTGDRVVWSGWADANNYLVLHFVSGILRLESFVGGVSQGFVAVPGVDDGGSHSAVLYWDEVAGTLSLDVDGQGLEGPEAFVNGTFDTWTDPTIPDGWLKSNHDADNYSEQSPAGSMRLISDGSNISVIQIALTPGLVYNLTTSDVVVTTGNMALWYGSGLQFTLPGGTSTAIIEPSSTNAALKRVSGATDVSIGGITGKAIYSRTGLTLPTNLNQFMLGHKDGANQLNGYFLEHAAANGDQLSAWAA